MDNQLYSMQSFEKKGISMTHFKGRSFYNLLQIQCKEGSQVESWKKCDYRKLSVEDLLELLQKIDVSLTVERFLTYADECDSPEELAECLSLEEEGIKPEKIYLIVFELWRRLLPDKQTLSIFCDQLDYLIACYEESGKREDALEQALRELEDLLDQSLDQGMSNQEIFESITEYMAHDLEGFLYDYIVEVIDEDNDVYASELIDGMFPYVLEKKWFDLLRARLFYAEASPETDILLARLLEEAEEKKDSFFLMEVVSFLVHRGDTPLFMKAAYLLLEQIDTEEELIDLVNFIIDFCNSLDLSADSFEKFLAGRTYPSTRTLTQEDRKFLKTLLSKIN